MRRLCTMRRVIFLTLLLASAPAVAQQPGHLLAGAPAPPAMMPGPASSPGCGALRQYDFPDLPRIDVPGGPSSYSDEVQRCTHARASAGLAPNESAAFARGCAND